MPRADRLFTLANSLAGRKRWTLAELSEKLGRTPRTIYRDLAALEKSGVPIERGDGTYRLVDGAVMRPLQLTGRERLVLDLALDASAIVRHESFRTEAIRLRAKITAANRDEEVETVAAASGPDRSGSVPAAIVEKLERAIGRKQSVSILYTSLTRGMAEWRGVDPWMLVHRSEAWYLFGRCHIHDEPRTFRLDRIDDVFSIGSSFRRPPLREVRKLIDSRWGIFAGEPLTECVVVFAKRLAPLIESATHHPTESKRRQADGSLEYCVAVPHIGELARWVAGFSGEARAISPPALVETVRAIAAAVLKEHVGSAAEEEPGAGSLRPAARRVSAPRRR